MGGRFAMKSLFLMFLTALAAQNSPAQQSQDPWAIVSWTPATQVSVAAKTTGKDAERISDSFAKTELLALSKVEREDFTTWEKSPARAALDAADAKAKSPQEKLISTHMKWLHQQKWSNHQNFKDQEKLKDFPTMVKILDAFSGRINMCIKAEEDALQKGSAKLPGVCEHDVIWVPYTKEEMAALQRESGAAMRDAPVFLDMSRAEPLEPLPGADARPTQAPPVTNNTARRQNLLTTTRRKDIPTIAKAANGTIVSIVTSDKDGHAIAQGTGFLISKDGRIVTNYHVIENGSSAVAKLPDGAFFVVDGVLASDKARDVAVIKAHGENFRTLTLGNSDRLEVGEEVVAIGNPLSLESTVSNGIVSGIRAAEDEGGKFLQVTTPISPGSSGGPLFNMAGEVVGITTLYLEGGENLNFAIPINDAKRLLLAKSSKIQALPNEPEPVRAQAHGTGSVASDRDYYQQLFDAGGFVVGKDLGGHIVLNSDYVCFSDDTHSGTFFAFKAMYYDENYVREFRKYSDLLEKLLHSPGSTDLKEETEKQYYVYNEIEQSQNAPPYVEFVAYYVPELQKIFPHGGRYLRTKVYEKGIEVDTDAYLWDGSSWFDSIPSRTNTILSKIRRLSIEPSTLRYVESVTVPTTTGSGETASTETSRRGPWIGACEKIPDPK